MRKIISALFFPLLAIAGPVYVDSWPRQIGGTWNPTPDQCRAVGYELRANRPQSEIDAEEAKAAIAASNAAVQAVANAAIAASNAAVWQAQQTARSNAVAAVRGKYHAATRAMCRAAGVAETNVLTSAQIEALMLPLLEDADTNAKLKRNNKVVAYMVQLEFLSRVLEREDGTDALDRL